MAQLLDIICIVFLGGWAYLVAKRKNRDEVGWAMAVAATFYIFGLAANQVAFPKLLDAGAFSALGSANLLGEKFDTQGQDPVPPELAEKVRLQARQEQWQTASGFVVGVPCGILLNLILTFLIRPLPTSEQRPPGGPPPTAAGDGSPPKDEQPERPADSAEGDAPAQEMAAAPPDSSVQLGALVARFWPVLIPAALFAALFVPGVSTKLRLNPPANDPTKDVRFFLLVPTLGILFWRLRGRALEGILAGLFTLAFVPAITTMEWRWSKSDSYYSHGYLIPVVVAALLWRQRKRLAAAGARGDFRVGGLLILGFGLFLHVAGCFIRMNAAQYLAFVAVLVGLVAFLYGRAVTRLVAFPLLFTIAMLPMPMAQVQSYTFRLKTFATSGSCHIVNALRAVGLHPYKVRRVGSQVKWPMSEAVWDTLSARLAELDERGAADGARAKELVQALVSDEDKIIVGDVCSGLRSLIALTAFGALFAYVTRLSLARRLILFAASVPIALLANMWRIVTLTFIACFWGSTATHGWVHDVTGYGIFAVAFVLFFGLERVLQKFEPTERDQPPAAAATA